MPSDVQRQMDEAGKSRRDFMKVTGLAAMGGVIAGCTAKEETVKPMLNKQEGITPGMRYEYATACGGCSAGCGTLMQVRDGRPIKAEGNPQHPVNKGGLCVIGQGSMTELYDPDRLRKPMMGDSETSWGALDSSVRSGLKAAGSGVRLLTGTVNGHAAKAQIAKFLKAFPGAKHVSYNANSRFAIAKAHNATHGVQVIPTYRFENADVIVSVGADFLGNWVSTAEHAKGWAQNRNLKPANLATNKKAKKADYLAGTKKRKMSRHVQFEARMSMTGANSDERFRLPESEFNAFLVALGNEIAGGSPLGKADLTSVDAKTVKGVASELKAAGRKGLVVCGSNDADTQTLVNFINAKLGAYGTTVDLVRHSQQWTGDDEALAQLIKDMESGTAKAIVLWNVNPVYDLPNGARFAELLKKASLSVAMNDRADETAKHCQYIAPDHHWLESWNDFEPVKGVFTLSQPTINPLWDTRSALTSLLKWAGHADGNKNYRVVLRDHWKANVLGGTDWLKAVEIGFVDRSATGSQPAFRSNGVKSGLGKKATGEGFEVLLFESYALGDGAHANNAWLQESPDPITKQTWGNGAIMAPTTMAELGVKQGDHVEIKIGDTAVTLPAVRGPGQTDNSVAIALGYGRTDAGRIIHGMGIETEAIGANAYGLAGAGVRFGSVSVTGGSTDVAITQTHDSQEGRPIAKDTSLKEWHKDGKSGNKHEIPDERITLWKGWDYKGHRWGMAIDLNLCIGCNACQVSCSIENNVPVVGKEEVLMRREMHWMRIDRYFEDHSTGLLDGKVTDHENPETAFQPMPCQHCENAPCETVCPVGATVHSDEGLNAQAYNRCVGTRYCANNCPYKVRRFNWFDYKHEDKVMNLTLNPDITQRSRGVMEKCSMCVQRIWTGKREAARKGKKPVDGAIQTACQQSCPTDAIAFGDMNDPETVVSKIKSYDPRHYGVIEEINTRPAVTYLTQVRNRAPKKHGGEH